jgi:6-phosphogluconate dehydrogenase
MSISQVFCFCKWSSLNKVVAVFYLISYQQELELIFATNVEYKLDINILEVLRIWQGGCIIRSKMLLTISEHYKQGKYPQELHNQVVDSISELSILLLDNQIIVPLPVINSTRDYIISMESQKLSQNITKAQRVFLELIPIKELTERESLYWRLEYKFGLITKKPPFDRR